MNINITIEKKHILTIILLVMAVVSFGIVSATGGSLVQFTPLSQITSDDAGFNVIDDGTGRINASYLAGGSVPSGGIIMWSGLIADIPTGWTLADGTLGTPDLQSKFVRGAAIGVEAGGVGGSESHTHQPLTPGSYGMHTYNTPGAPSSRSASNMPPYYDVLFIMKL